VWKKKDKYLSLAGGQKQDSKYAEELFCEHVAILSNSSIIPCINNNLTEQGLSATSVDGRQRVCHLREIS